MIITPPVLAAQTDLDPSFGPPSGYSKAIRRLRMAVFPDSLGPMLHTFKLVAISKSMSRSTYKFLKILFTNGKYTRASVGLSLSFCKSRLYSMGNVDQVVYGSLSSSIHPILPVPHYSVQAGCDTSRRDRSTLGQSRFLCSIDSEADIPLAHVIPRFAR